MYKTFNQVLGIIDTSGKQKVTIEIPEDIQQLAQERDTAKKEKNFEKADQIRDQLLELGYTIKDSREGIIIEKS